LLAAVAATPMPEPVRKVEFVINLFDRLERQDRQAGWGRSAA
jgi:hypothetical protein